MYSLVSAQEEENPLPEADAVQSAEEAKPASTETARPFSARIEIDSRMPISYGDEVAISVWITPTEGIDLQHVKIHPQGDLARIYASTEKAVVDSAAGPGLSGKEVDGITCRTERLNRQAGIPFVATCKLSSRKVGWQKWADWNALMGAGRHQVDVEIALQDGYLDTDTYYDSGGIDFVSPKSAVILGGFVGALLWSLFLWISPKQESVAPEKRVRTWRDLYVRAKDSLPGQVSLLLGQIWKSIRDCLLGGLTAMVLIILARSTEGSDPSISIRVQDFWGGLLVGLASSYISKKIREQVEKFGT